MARKGGIAILIAGAVLALPATAGASMQLFAIEGQSSTRTFHTLRGLNQSPEPDVVSVSQSGPDVVIRDTAGITSFPADCRAIDQNTAACPFSNYDDVSLRVGAGNDRVVSTLTSPQLTLKQILGPSVSVYMNATLGPGNDRFTGAAATDAAFGGAGRDRITGGGGTDYLEGDTGTDRLVAGPGRRDLMVGSKGPDLCIGEPKDLVVACERVRVR
jgi:hypothetical protein